MTSPVTDTPESGRPPPPGEVAWHTLSPGQVLRSSGTDERRGLSSAEAVARARRFGPNKLATVKAEPRWHAFLRQYRDPMQMVLLAAGIGSLYPLRQLGTGLLLTELMGQGVNFVTGDYSRGASGFWVENGKIQYPVEEITVASTLQEMFHHIVAVGADTLARGTRQTGSVLIERMTVAGQ